MEHLCPDGVTHDWVPRTPNPKVCPRCKKYLNKPAVKVKKPEEVIDLGEHSEQAGKTGATGEDAESTD